VGGPLIVASIVNRAIDEPAITPDISIIPRLFYQNRLFLFPKGILVLEKGILVLEKRTLVLGKGTLVFNKKRSETTHLVCGER
jgi:hypothetical protein